MLAAVGFTFVAYNKAIKQDKNTFAVFLSINYFSKRILASY